MKTVVLPFIFLFLTISSSSQSIDELKVDTKKMYDASYNMSFDEIISLTYPKLFDLIPREQMSEMLDNMFQNESMKIRFVHANPKFNYAEIKKINNKSYCVITYLSAMRMTFEQKLSEEEVSAMKKSFLDSGNYSTVNFEKERNSFFIEGDAQMIAIADESTKNKWKYVNYDKSQKQLATMILGEEILKELGL